MGLIGLVLLLSLCACTGLLAVEGNNFLSLFGLTNSTGGNPAIGSNTNTGGGGPQTLKFPTATFGSVSSQATPGGGDISPSQTQLPNTTPTTPGNPNGNGNPTPGGGGGGGGSNTAQFQCSGGSNGSVTWTFSPCPLVHGRAGTLTISAPKYPNVATNIILSFGNCPTNNDCTQLYTPASYKLDASGTETISFTVPADVQVNGPPVSGPIELAGGPTVGINTQGSVT
jgi:hypothetical protein